MLQVILLNTIGELNKKARFIRKRVIIHWTAGTNQVSSADFQHYHYIVNGDAVVVEGKFPITANENCKADTKGNALYAAHTGGGNTGSIGVSMCGMANFNGKPESTKYPLTAVQCERTFKLVAEICKKHNIAITPDTVMTHYEFGQKHPKTSSAGKIDIIYLPPFPNVAKNDVGDFIRNKVKWYLTKI